MVNSKCLIIFLFSRHILTVMIVFVVMITFNIWLDFIFVNLYFFGYGFVPIVPVNVMILVVVFDIVNSR